MKESTCCFTGHRELPVAEIPRLKEILDSEIEKQINLGKCIFCCGGALGFDTLAANSVLALKERYPHIKLLLFLPHKKQSSAFKDADKREYERILSLADGVSYASSEYNFDCMFKRNRQLADASSVCIEYLDKGTGGTLYTVKYARKNGLQIINLAKLLRGINDEN